MAIGRVPNWATDFGCLLALFCFITFAANWVWFTGDKEIAKFVPEHPTLPFSFSRTHPTHLSAEAFNVAKAIYEGRGFSDPFGDQTGPTGWTPPVLSSLMAAALWASGGSRESVALIFMVLQNLILALVCTACLQTGRRLKAVGPMILAIFLVLLTNFTWIFQITDDCIFLMFWVALTLVGLWRWPLPPSKKLHLLCWGVFGGAAALSGPAAGFCWAASTSVCWGWRHWKEVALVGVVSAVIVAPWIGYQSSRLGMFVPIKSNASFEIYQSQRVLVDGLVSEYSYPRHPYHSRSKEGKRYREVGERAYLAEKKQVARDSLAEDPLGFMDKVASRFLAATVWLHSDRFRDVEHPQFFWCQMMAAVPFLGLLGIFLFGSSSTDTWIKPAICCYVFYLLPYVLVSYYERYGVPATLPKILFTFWFFRSVRDQIRIRFSGNRPKT